MNRMEKYKLLMKEKWRRMNEQAADWDKTHPESAPEAILFEDPTPEELKRIQNNDRTASGEREGLC